MSKSKEQSAIDAIYTMLDRIELLDKRVQIIDDNVKILSNKISKLSRNTAVAASSSSVAQNITRQEPQKQQESDNLVLGKIKAYGYIVSKVKAPIENVIVNIYDGNNKRIKNTKTNNDGYWEVRLPPGKFGVEYIHKNFKPINRVVELTDDIRNYEVR